MFAYTDRSKKSFVASVLQFFLLICIAFIAIPMTLFVGMLVWFSERNSRPKFKNVSRLALSAIRRSLTGEEVGRDLFRREFKTAASGQNLKPALVRKNFNQERLY